MHPTLPLLPYRIANKTVEPVISVSTPSNKGVTGGQFSQNGPFPAQNGPNPPQKSGNSAFIALESRERIKGKRDL
jgi:hypothetical protein